MEKELDNIEEPRNESTAVRMFRSRCEVAMSHIQNYKEWEKEETMVHEVMQAGRTLFDKPLDQMSPDFLLRIGGRLSGAYGYLGQKASYARAERDVYEQKLSETEKRLQLEMFADDPKYKVTLAKAKVAVEVEELREMVIQKESAKNQWENLLEACDKMISFVQSAIKVKEGERFMSSRVQNQ